MLNVHLDDELHHILLDGQQRLRAIKAYRSNEFQVVGEDRLSNYWSELADAEKNQLLLIAYPFIDTSYTSEDELRNAYDRHNFGGMSHDEFEQASTQPASAI
jgi:hypothetical protein